MTPGNRLSSKSKLKTKGKRRLNGKAKSGKGKTSKIGKTFTLKIGKTSQTELQNQVEGFHSVAGGIFFSGPGKEDLLMTQLHLSIVHRGLGNSMGIISKKFQYLAAILQLEKTITAAAGNSTTDILSTLFQCLNFIF